MSRKLVADKGNVAIVTLSKSVLKIIYIQVTSIIYGYTSSYSCGGVTLHGVL